MTSAGFIYVIEEDSGHCRFGFSSKDNHWGNDTNGLQIRVASVVRYSPQPSRLAFTMFHHRAEQLEQALQYLFRHLSANGDWFKISSDQVLSEIPSAIILEKRRNFFVPKICAWMKATGISDRDISIRSGLSEYQVKFNRGKSNLSKHTLFEALFPVMVEEDFYHQSLKSSA